MNLLSFSIISAFHLPQWNQTVEVVDQMWEKMSQLQPLLGMSRDEVFITFQNLQLAANLPYGLLNMNVESKIFIDPDTKKLHCIGNIDDSVIKRIRVALRHIKGEKGLLPVGMRHPKTALLKLPIIYTWTVADPGKGLGPLLLLDQTKARRAEKTFLETAPTYLRVWMTAPPPTRYLKVWFRHCINVPDNRDGGSWNLLTFLTHGLCFRELFYAFYLAGMKSVWSMTFWHPK